jgi:curved DNA-binding protein CbpA
MSFSIPAHVGIPNTYGPSLPHDHWLYKCHYSRLGLPRNTKSQDLIKAHYRCLARRYHPDKNKEEGDGEKFKAVKEAKDFIIDN